MVFPLVEFGISAELSGKQDFNQGQQILNSDVKVFLHDDFVKRLREAITAAGKTGQYFAQAAGITKQAFSGYLNTERVPSATVLSSWVYTIGINANWLLTGKGSMFLHQEKTQSDPIAQRVDQVARTMREAGVDELKILAAARDMLDGEMAKLARAKGGYTCAEPPAGVSKAAEDPAAYPDPRKAVGDDSV